MEQKDTELRIEPTAELALKLGGKRVGRLEYLSVDLAEPQKFFQLVPKMKLVLSIESSAFESPARAERLANILGKMKMLEIILKK